MFNIYQFEKQAKHDSQQSEKWAKEVQAKTGKRRTQSSKLHPLQLTKVLLCYSCCARPPRIKLQKPSNVLHQRCK